MVALLGNFLLGLLYAVLGCAVVIFIAFCIKWAFDFFGYPIEGNVYKWGKIIVGLICIIILVSFLVSFAIAVAGGAPYRPMFWGRY